VCGSNARVSHPYMNCGKWMKKENVAVYQCCQEHLGITQRAHMCTAIERQHNMHAAPLDRRPETYADLTAQVLYGVTHTLSSSWIFTQTQPEVLRESHMGWLRLVDSLKVVL